jgi:hypothetical protein
MTITNGYATDEELREQFDDGGSILPEALLHRAINATSRAIDDYCDRRFWQDQTVVARTYRPEHPTMAWVDDISTSTGLVVKVDSGMDGTFATTWTLNSEFVLRPGNAAADGRPWFQVVAVDGNTFYCSARDTLQVTAKFGWAAIPDEVNQACILRAAALFKRRESIDGVRGFDSFGVVRISNRRDPDVVELLQGFVRTDRMVA